MTRTISTESFRGQGVYTGPYGHGVIDLEQPELADVASVSLEVRCGGSGPATVSLEARDWDTDSWTVLDSRAVSGLGDVVFSVPVDEGKEL